jgi:serine/threonine-protein kinase
LAIREPDSVVETDDPELRRARDRVGKTLRGKWRLDRLIGIGGMAAVYAATHRNGLRGAVKMLHLPLSLAGDVRDRFLREGYAANRVAHPGVVRVLDDDTAEDGAIFLVMELLEGQTVDARAEATAGQVLDPGEVLAIADAALDVLAVAHDRGIIHRDIKPENLFLTKTGELKLLDFGIARLRELGSVRATTTGSTMGTPAFMPPEQASGRWNLVDGRSDIWAVGATMFTLLTGRLVHEEQTPQLIMAASMTKPAPPLASVTRSAPNALAAIVDRALAFEVDERWPNARAMQQAVRAAQLELGGSRGALTPKSLPATAAPLKWRSAPKLDPTELAPPVHGTTSPVSTAAHKKTSGARTPAVLFLIGAVVALVGGGFFIARLAKTSPAASAEASADAAPITALPAPTETASSTPNVAPAPTAVAAAAPSAPETATPSASSSAEAPRAAPRHAPVVQRPKPPAPTPTPTPTHKHEGIF